MAGSGVVKLRRGEREVWRGTYWVLTTEGIERYRTPRKWLPFEGSFAMKGWDAEPLVPDAVLMCWYARRPELVDDIEEWIALWREACRLRGAPTQHAERLEAIARRNYAKGIERVERKRREQMFVEAAGKPLPTFMDEAGNLIEYTPATA
jgi:hypothetical protein